MGLNGLIRGHRLKGHGINSKTGKLKIMHVFEMKIRKLLSPRKDLSCCRSVVQRSAKSTDGL